MPTLTEHPAVESTREAIARVRQAGGAYALALATEAALLREKAGKKGDAIRRLLQLQNDLTGRQHSATSAEAVVELDAEYHAFLRQCTSATCDVAIAKTELVAARLEAQLALALVLGDDEL